MFFRVGAVNLFQRCDFNCVFFQSLCSLFITCFQSSKSSVVDRQSKQPNILHLTDQSNSLIHTQSTVPRKSAASRCFLQFILSQSIHPDQWPSHGTVHPLQATITTADQAGLVVPGAHKTTMPTTTTAITTVITVDGVPTQDLDPLQTKQRDHQDGGIPI